jgi:AbiU2
LPRPYPWDLQDACNRDGYESVLEEYQHFFQATIRAHLVTLIVRSYTLYDKIKGTRTMRSLLDRLQRETSSTAVTSELQHKIDELQDTWLKIKLVQHNVFARRSETCQADSTFRAANLTPDEIRRFILQSRQIVATIANEAGMPSIFEEEISPTPHTQAVMQTLRDRWRNSLSGGAMAFSMTDEDRYFRAPPTAEPCRPLHTELRTAGEVRTASSLSILDHEPLRL